MFIKIERLGTHFDKYLERVLKMSKNIFKKNRTEFISQLIPPI